MGAGVGVEDGVEVALEDFEEDIGGEALGAVVVVEVAGGEQSDAVAGEATTERRSWETMTSVRPYCFLRSLRRCEEFFPGRPR